MSGLFSRQTKTVPATPAATKPAGDRAVVSAGGHRLGPIVGQVESTNIRFRLRDTVLVVGAPGSGKTSGIVIPYVADSAGAARVRSTPLPAGAEVTILEVREAWTHIQVTSTTKGWVKSSAVAPVNLSE